MLNNNLRIFYVVAEHKSITSAAESLYISVPAVSQAVKALEKKLDTKLFIRNRHAGMILTPVGEQIFQLTGQMLSLEEQIYQTVHREKGLLSGTIRIGAIPAVTGSLLAKPIAAFHQRYPEIHIDIQEGTPHDMIHMLECAMIDFAVSATPLGNMESQILIEDEMVAIFPSDQTSKKELVLKKEMEGYILTKAAAETLSEQTRTLIHLNAHRNFIVQDTETVIRFVKAGNGIGIVSRFALEALQNQLPRCCIIPEVKIRIGVTCRDFGDLSPAAGEFVKMLKENPSFEMISEKGEKK